VGGEFPEEVKPLSAAPKFGWIIGVFVSLEYNMISVIISYLSFRL